MISGKIVSNQRFADHKHMLGEEINTLKSSLNSVIEAAEPMGLLLNIAKAKFMVFWQQEFTKSVTVKGGNIEHATEFEYQVSLLDMG